MVERKGVSMNDDEWPLHRNHLYDRWQALTESDFVTLFIKTWFAFIATLRELYPDKEKPYYNAAGDSPYLSAYKLDFQEKYFFLCTYDEIEESMIRVYREGYKKTVKCYPRFVFDDFYQINEKYNSKKMDKISSSGGYSGEITLALRARRNGVLNFELIYVDKKFKEKTGLTPVLTAGNVDYQKIVNDIISDLEKKRRRER